MIQLLTPLDFEFTINIAFCMVLGFIIGLERALKDKPTGINTQIYVITAAMLFTFISKNIPGSDPARISAQIVSGIGFLGAGIIMKKTFHSQVSNVTTAANIWMTAAIGMAIGYQYYFIAILTTLCTVIASRIPHFHK